MTETEKVIEETLDTIESTLDAMEAGIEKADHAVFGFLKNPAVIAIGITTAGILVGAGATYLVLNKKLQKKYQAMADAEVQDVKDTYLAVTKKDVSLEEMASHIPDDAVLVATEERVRTEQDRWSGKKLIETEGYTSYEKVTPAEEQVEEEITVTQAIVEATMPRVRNVFESDHPETYFDFREETERREAKPNDPYVITKEEFDLNETDFNQTSLTYYDGDDVLSDERDTPIEDVDRVVGVENLLRFGHGSGDKNIVYIRNARLQLDIEVSHSDGKFAKEVLGFDDELKHSQRRPPRKMRPSDD